jgi:hypothetical protein
MPQTTSTLYSVARRDSDGDRFFDIATGVDQRQVRARLEQDGVEPSIALQWTTEAARSAIITLELRSDVDTIAASGDVFTYNEAGPRRETYKIVATAVSARLASAV